MRTSTIEAAPPPDTGHVVGGLQGTGERPEASDGPDTGVRSGGSGRSPQATLTPWAVVALWGLLLGLLTATGAAFGNSTFVLEVAGSAAGFVLLLAAAVWLHHRLRPRRSYLRQPTRVGGVVLLAVAAALGWLGLAFGGWIVIPAGVALLAAIGLEVSARRRTRPRQAAAIAALPGRQAPASAEQRADPEKTAA
jgi:hypothetical protein